MESSNPMTDDQLTDRQEKLNKIMARSETTDSIQAAAIGLELITELKQTRLQLSAYRAHNGPSI